ncbi:hypothetical protein AGR9A_Cc140054 [Agrobacterium salinitolerans str. Hayward 0363]|nr:hypothetical protein AGR9A_Cc140054 [Agrobacterium salinitolerans str. Hayward 0363]
MWTGWRPRRWRHSVSPPTIPFARVGRGRQVELFFIVPKNWPLRRLGEWDAIRDEIGDALGGEGSDRWLTVVFTTDEEWAA